MDENNYINQNEENDGIDAIALISCLWQGRKVIIKWTCIFIVLGLFAALTMKRKYAVKTVMVPQIESKANSSLSSLASLAGFDLSSLSANTDMSPLVYPEIVNSVPFRMELMYTPVHYEDIDTAVSMYSYAYEIDRFSLVDSIVKYTIGLPFVLLNAIKGEKEDIVLPDDSLTDNGPKPLVVTEKELALLEKLGESISLVVDKKEGKLTLMVKGSEPIQTAELALKAQQLLQDEITRFRVEKSQSQLDYIQARYDEVKKEAEYYQERLAIVTDRSQNLGTARDKIELSQIQTKYNVANAIYTEMAKQLEQAKMQVKKDTPVFTVVQPVKVPNKSANSRTKTLILWTFFGGVIGCCVVLYREFLPKIKKMFTVSSGDDEGGESEETGSV